MALSRKPPFSIFQIWLHALLSVGLMFIFILYLLPHGYLAAIPIAVEREHHFYLPPKEGTEMFKKFKIPTWGHIDIIAGNGSGFLVHESDSLQWNVTDEEFQAIQLLRYNFEELALFLDSKVRNKNKLVITFALTNAGSYGDIIQILDALTLVQAPRYTIRYLDEREREFFDGMNF